MVLGLLIILVIMFRWFWKWGNGNHTNGNSKPHHFPDRRNNTNGITVMEYLQTEIKPDITKMREEHQSLRDKVASLPTREEIDQKMTVLHTRIDNIHKE